MNRRRPNPGFEFRIKPKSKPKPKSSKPKSPKPKSPILKAPNGPEMCVKLADETNCKKPYCQVFNCKSGKKIEEYTDYIKTILPQCEENKQLYCEKDTLGSKVFCGCKNIRAIDKKCQDGYEIYTEHGGMCSNYIRTGQVCPQMAVMNYYCRLKTNEPTCIEQASDDINCVNPECKMFKCKIGANFDNYRELISCDYDTQELICASKPGNSEKVYCKCIPNKARMTDFNNGIIKPSCRPEWEMYETLLPDGDCTFEVFPSSECTPKMYKLCRKNV